MKKKKDDSDTSLEKLVDTIFGGFSQDNFFKSIDLFLGDLNEEDIKKLFLIMIDKPKLAFLIFYVYTEPEWIKLRLILFAAVLFSKLVGIKKDEEFRKVFIQEWEDLKSEISEIADLLIKKGCKPEVWQSFSDLPLQFMAVVFADNVYLRKYGVADLSIDPKERGNLIRKIRESTFKKETRTGEDDGYVVELRISYPEEPVVTLRNVVFPSGRMDRTVIIDFSDLNEAKKFKQLKHPAQYLFVELLTKEYKRLGEESNLRSVQNTLLIDRGWEEENFLNEVVILHAGKEIYRFPMSLFSMVRPVVSKAIHKILSDKTKHTDVKEEFTSEALEKFFKITRAWNSELENKGKQFSQRFKQEDIYIACAIHDMALHFPEGFEKIMGYYRERAKFERQRIAGKFQEKHPTESLDQFITIEHPGSLETKEVDKKDLIQFDRYRRGELEDEEEKLCRKIRISQTENKLEDSVDKKIFRGIAEGKTQKEIADILGISKAAVSKRIDKIAKKIKKMVE